MRRKRCGICRWYERGVHEGAHGRCNTVGEDLFVFGVACSAIVVGMLLAVRVLLEVLVNRQLRRRRLSVVRVEFRTYCASTTQQSIDRAVYSKICFIPCIYAQHNWKHCNSAACSMVAALFSQETMHDTKVCRWAYSLQHCAFLSQTTGSRRQPLF